jgi:hypothetical protein
MLITDLQAEHVARQIEGADLPASVIEHLVPATASLTTL